MVIGLAVLVVGSWFQWLNFVEGANLQENPFPKKLNIKMNPNQ